MIRLVKMGRAVALVALAGLATLPSGAAWAQQSGTVVGATGAQGAAQGTAQDRAKTLADMRAELSGLYAQITGLKQELQPGTLGANQTAPIPGSVQERLDSIEARLAQLTNQTEELQHRISVVVADGTRRIGDLNFRLCELEKGCDIGKLKKTPTLGLDATAPAPGVPAATTTNEAGTTSTAPDLAVGEQADFNKAKAVLDAGDYQKAADQFATFTQTYTAGPLTGQAHFYRGQALTQLGKTADAARAYLDSFSGSPDGPRAPDALTQLGISLGQLGQVQEACVTLGQVKVRYPASSAVGDAAAAMQNLGCTSQ